VIGASISPGYCSSVTRFRGSGWVLLALALSACGKTQAPAGGGGVSVGGTGATASDEPRLVPWQLQAEGSEPLVIGVFDREREQHCRFVPDAAGELRCLPLTPGALELTVHFADAECQRPIYRSELPAAEAVREALEEPMALPLELADCEQRFVVARVTELAADAPHYILFGGTSCGPSMMGPLADQVDFVRDAPLDPKNYVSGELAPGALLGDRIRVQEIEAADGSRFQEALYDEHWQKPCKLSERRGSLACLPASLDENTNYHVDAACEGESVWGVRACAEPAFIGQSSFELYALGEPWTGAVYEYGKGCREVSFPPDNGARFYERGGLLGDDAVAAVQWFQAGGGLLQRRGLRNDTGELFGLDDRLFGDSGSLRGAPGRVVVPRYHDSETGVDCWPIWTSEGDVRCVPSTVQIEPYSFEMYADAACSRPAYACFSQEPCVGTDLIVMGYDARGEYRGLSRHAAVAVQGDSIFSLQTGGCLASPPLGDMNMFESGEELPWDDYPLLSELNGG
jgi:hypothetical protein